MRGALTAPGPDLLAAIVAAARQVTADRERRCPAAVLRQQAASATPRGARFVAALTAPGRVRVIAECKRRSPSCGILRANYHPDRVAAGYEANGAVAVSVLTEPTFFDGSLEHLRAVRATVDVPILRKDFIVTNYQLLEAVAAGADAVLLIVAALDDTTLGALLGEATALGLAALVEVHDEAELQSAVRVGATIIGVNNRNLRTLSVDVNASHSLIGKIPPGIVAVAESGLRTSADLVALGAAGYHAFLIGETLISTPAPGRTLRRLLGGAGPVSGGAEGAMPLGVERDGS